MSTAAEIALLPAKGSSCSKRMAGSASTTGNSHVSNRRRINENKEEVLRNGLSPESLSTTGRLNEPVNRR